MISSLRNSGGLLRQGMGAGQLRVYSQDARGAFSRQAARRRTLKETATAPASGSAISAGYSC